MAHSDMHVGHRHHAHAGHYHNEGRASTGTAKDPVCGMTVDPATAKHSVEHDGQRQYFCCAGCASKFTADPARYLAPNEEPRQPMAPTPAGTIYTCPMHPQIRQVGPGSCPICGMALEPEVVTAEAG